EGGEIGKEGCTTEVERRQAGQGAEPLCGQDGEIAMKMKERIDTYVKPAGGMDGGNIDCKGCERGKVSVGMQGSCSGCPSSSVTLKSGIEGMLRRMVPEVEEVVQEMG